jgi:hypothetical protein
LDEKSSKSPDSDVKDGRKTVNSVVIVCQTRRSVGSIAEELSAGVSEGLITRRDLGQRLTRKGFQASAVSRALGSAVKKWGTLSRIEIPSGETCYVQCDGPYDTLDQYFKRHPSNRFTFRLRKPFQGMSRYTCTIPLLVDVIANESSMNCKAKVAVVPLGDREVQAYWQPHDALSIDLNQGETVRVELAQLANPLLTEISNYESTLKKEKDAAVIEHVKMRLQQTYENAAGQNPVCFVRTPDVEGGNAWGVDGLVVYILILTIYSIGGMGWFPFLLMRKHLEDSEMVPIINYESKGVQWSGKELYTG